MSGSSGLRSTPQSPYNPSEATQWYPSDPEEDKFLAAVRDNQVDKAVAAARGSFCCGSGVPVDCFDRNGDTALHIAVESGNLRMVRELLKCNATVDSQRIRDGNTPVHLASRADCVDILECLLDSSASAQIPNSDGLVPVALTAASGPAVHVIQMLAEGNNSVNFGCVNTLKSQAGQTALHCAAFAGYEENVIQLLTCKADPSILDMQGRLPIHHAAAQGHAAALKALLQPEGTSSALVNQPESNQHTALHLACTGGFDSVVDLLLAAKSDPNAVDGLKQTALHKAVNTISDALGMVKLLLAHNADKDAEDVNGKTPLSYVLTREAASMPSSREGKDLKEVKMLLQPSEGSEDKVMEDVGKSLHRSLRQSRCSQRIVLSEWIQRVHQIPICIHTYTHYN